jgi:hypothetical protein
MKKNCFSLDFNSISILCVHTTNINSIGRINTFLDQHWHCFSLFFLWFHLKKLNWSWRKNRFIPIRNVFETICQLSNYFKLICAIEAEPEAGFCVQGIDIAICHKILTFRLRRNFLIHCLLKLIPQFFVIFTLIFPLFTQFLQFFFSLSLSFLRRLND